MNAGCGARGILSVLLALPACALLTLSRGQPALFGGAGDDDDESVAASGSSRRRHGRLLHGLVAHVGASLRGDESLDDLSAGLRRAGRMLG
jgi:hypothetical protein